MSQLSVCHHLSLSCQLFFPRLLFFSHHLLLSSSVLLIICPSLIICPFLDHLFFPSPSVLSFTIYPILHHLSYSSPSVLSFTICPFLHHLSSLSFPLPLMLHPLLPLPRSIGSLPPQQEQGRGPLESGADGAGAQDLLGQAALRVVHRRGVRRSRRPAQARVGSRQNGNGTRRTLHRLLHPSLGRMLRPGLACCASR